MTHSTTSWAETVSWVATVTGAAVVASTPLVGGMSSVVARHELADGRTVVSRHITDRGWLAREPHLIDAEATALDLMAQRPGHEEGPGSPRISAPGLLGKDAAAGRLLMSFVPGAMATASDQLRSRAAAIAGVARQIHQVELPGAHGLPPWRSWAAQNPAPPTWGDAGLWADAIAAFHDHAEPGTSRPVLLHRDLHPLNILWDGDTAHVVDWVNACVGHPHAELGHTRWNLTVLAGLEAADSLLDQYLIGSDEPYDQFWDLAPALSFLPNPPGGAGWRAVGRVDLSPTTVIEHTETFVRAVLERAASR